MTDLEAENAKLRADNRLYKAILKLRHRDYVRSLEEIIHRFTHPEETTVTTTPTDTPAPPLPDVIYRGHRDGDTGNAVICVHTPVGHEIGQVLHRAHHATGGYNWGYNGSGAADCARSLLAAALGDAHAVCRTCLGTNKITYVDGAAVPRAARESDDPTLVSSCDYCEVGLVLHPIIYQRFKEVFVSGWGHTFVITRKAIIEWLRGNYPASTWPDVT